MPETLTAAPKVVSREEWLAARKELLEQEKALTRQSDAVNAARRRLPMVELDKDYTFDGPEGPVRLVDLFDGKRQLIVYHFMFEPGDPPPGKSGAPFTEGCPGCSHIADNLPHLSHIRARDTNLVMVSRAPMEKIAPFKKRMGWTVPWYSSFGSSFNYDFHVTADEKVAPIEYNFQTKEELLAKGHDYHIEGEQPGVSVFLKEDDRIFHTYSAYARGLDILLGVHHYLDLTPFGRQETWEDSPEGWPQVPTFSALRHHDKYEDAAPKSCCH